MERHWYVREYLPADTAPAANNEFDQSDPFLSEYYYLLTTEQKRNFNRCLMIACIRCGRVVFNNDRANEQQAWLMQAIASNALPILGLYIQQPPQLRGRIDDSWKVHLYSNTVHCLKSIADSPCHHEIRRN